MVGKKKMLFKRGAEKKGAFPTLGRDNDGQYGAVSPPSSNNDNVTEKPFNPEHYVIDTAENVTVSTLTNDRAFHSMKRFDCGGIDYDKNNRGSKDYTQERKNWYKYKKQQNQTYMPLRDNGSAFITSPESSFGMVSEADGLYNKKSTRVRVYTTRKWLGKYFAAKSPTWTCKGKGRRWSKGKSGEIVAVATGYSSIGSRSKSGSGSEVSSTDKDDNGKVVLSSVCLTYCDESGVREEQLVWDG